ncbi:uncharacterized protein BT62DRAFT_1011807 [Guyanagaster necrorhizus]|uniref:Uncharacterized protein n=1 Tax=Guyanagaster necrorhizus TaxID=856835 RepID=A0A9P7VHN2_9AGAR|nr:uncharacterized protein BT62DRAFT_1011807 [Guyanagaster necrorhizus MCA 3950]KAG7441223.1 hypothetical protein BT62DRAFT_1011807 [Guyanagaster necrorhizus MCA 3950]
MHLVRALRNHSLPLRSTWNFHDPVRRATPMQGSNHPFGEQKSSLNADTCYAFADLYISVKLRLRVIMLHSQGTVCLTLYHAFSIPVKTRASVGISTSTTKTLLAPRLGRAKSAACDYACDKDRNFPPAPWGTPACQQDIDRTEQNRIMGRGWELSGWELNPSFTQTPSDF